MIEPKKLKKRQRLKIAVIATVIATLIFISGGLFIAFKWKPVLKQTIQNTVLEVSDSLYHVEFDDIKLNLFTGSVYFKKLEINADSNIYQQMIKNRTAPENIFNLKIKELTIKNIKPLKVYFNRKLDIKEIKIQEPELIITYSRLNSKLNKPLDSRTTYERIKNTLKSAKLDVLNLGEIAFTYVDKSYQTPEITKINRLNINVKDILIDSISQFDSTRIFHSKSINVLLNDFRYPTADSLYIVEIPKLNISTNKKNLIIEGFKLKPRYQEMQFANLFERQNERYALSFDSIALDQIDFHSLIAHRTVSAKKITLNNGNLSIFLNRAKPKKTIDKAINYPHVALKRINWSVSADTVNIKSTDILYSEYTQSTQAKGTVKFLNLRGNIIGVTNDSALLNQNRYIHAYLKTDFMGRSDLNVHIRFNMLDKHAAFFYEGSLKNLDLDYLNPVSKPLAKISFSSGKIQDLSFSVNGNTLGASGTVKVVYDKLKIKLLKKESEDENMRKMGFLSFLANALIIKDANPYQNEPIRIVHPSHQRPHDASFFNLMWKVIFLGFKETIGITKKKEDEIKNTIESFKEMQKNREDRKLKRKKLKEEIE